MNSRKPSHTWHSQIAPTRCLASPCSRPVHWAPVLHERSSNPPASLHPHGPHLWSSPWSLVSPPGLLQSLPRPPTPGGTFHLSPRDPQYVCKDDLYKAHLTLSLLWAVTHQGSICLQEKGQISSIIRQLSTSSMSFITHLTSLCPPTVHSPQICLFPVFRASLLPLPHQGLLSSSFFCSVLHSSKSETTLQEALLDLTGQAGTSSVLLHSPTVFSHSGAPYFSSPICTYHRWCLQILGPWVWADGLFSGLSQGKTAQAVPTSSWPGGEALPWSQPWVPATYRLWFNLSKPWFPICNTGILTPVSGGSDENKMAPKSAKHRAITYYICCSWNPYLGSPFSAFLFQLLLHLP